jgi:hypothetical protein
MDKKCAGIEHGYAPRNSNAQSNPQKKSQYVGVSYGIFEWQGSGSCAMTHPPLLRAAGAAGVDSGFGCSNNRTLLGDALPIQPILTASLRGSPGYNRHLNIDTINWAALTGSTG